MRQIVLFCTLILLSVPCFAQYEIDDVKSITDRTSNWHKLFYEKKNLAKMKELYPTFKQYVEKLDMGILTYNQINKLYDFTVNYSKISGSDEEISKLSKAYKLFAGIKLYMGDEPFRKVPATSLNDYIDEVYRVLPVDLFGSARIKNVLDISTKKLLFKDGFAEYCITRPDPGARSNRNSVTSFKYAVQADVLLSLYRSYYEEESLIEPSVWFSDIWNDERYKSFKEGKFDKPGRPSSTWDLNGTIELLNSITREPAQRDVDILLGNLGSNWKSRGLLRVVLDMASFMKSEELKILLLEDLRKVLTKVMDENSMGKIMIYKLDKEEIESSIELCNNMLNSLENDNNTKTFIKEEYHSNGKRKLLEYYSKNGVLQTRQIYYESGSKKRQENYNKDTGLISSIIDRTEQGMIKKEEFYDENGKLCRYYSYGPKGKLAERSVQGPDGNMSVLEIFDENGKLEQKVIDVNGQEEYTMMVQSYNVNGGLVSTDYYNGSFLRKSVTGGIIETQKPEVVVSKSITEKETFMTKIDLYFSNMVERSMILNDADIDFIQGALDELTYIYEDEGTSEDMKVQARNYAILLALVSFQDDNKSNLTREQSVVVIEAANRIGLMSVTPLQMLQFMDDKKMDNVIQLKVMESYGRLLPAIKDHTIKK